MSEERARDDAALGDDDHAERQGVLREDVHAGMRSFGVSGVVVTAEKAIFNGPVVGGNATMATSAARVVLRVIPARTMREVSACFVPPPGFAELKAALHRDRLIVLRTRRRWGRTTLALRLLGDVAGAERVYGLVTDGGPVAEIRPDVIPSGGGGLLLDGLTMTQAAELRLTDIQRIAEMLVAGRSWLVVVVDETVHLSDPAVARTALPAGPPPGARDVVLRHLAFAMPGRPPNEIEEMLDIPRIADLLVNVQPQTYDIRQLAQLAGDVVELSRGVITVDEVLSRYESRSGQDVGDWFRGLTEPQFATAVSVAALHGMPYESISTAAQRLEDALVDKYGEPTGRRGRETRTDRLNAARTVLTTQVRSTRYGPVQMQVAAFLDETLPPRVLDHVWQEYDSDRDLLLDWLHRTSTDPSPSVRTRAATALGYLACHDFDKIRREVIVPWAGSDDDDERERAVAALAVPARHPRTRGLVFNLVADWSTRTGWRLRTAAARALGAAVGAVLPGGPDERLADLAKEAGPALAIAIGDSVAELMVDVGDERVEALLDMLATWSGEPLKDRQRAGVVGFLEVALTLWRAMPSSRDDGSVSEPWWPSLLFWSDPTYGTSSLRRRVVLLWQRALVTPGAQLPVARVLRRWASAAEADAALRVSFADLFLEIANGGPRQASIVRYHAKSWRGDGGDAPDTGRKLLDLLS